MRIRTYIHTVHCTYIHTFIHTMHTYNTYIQYIHTLIHSSFILFTMYTQLGQFLQPDPECSGTTSRGRLPPLVTPQSMDKRKLNASSESSPSKKPKAVTQSMFAAPSCTTCQSTQDSGSRFFSPFLSFSIWLTYFFSLSRSENLSHISKTHI